MANKLELINQLNANQLYAELKSLVKEDKKSDKAFSKDDVAFLTKGVLKLVEYSIIQLGAANSSVDDTFWSILLLQLPKYIDISEDLIAAIFIDKSDEYALIVNPYRIIDFTKNFKEFKEVIKHEGYHVLYNHLKLYHKVYPKDGEKLNIVMDLEINQHLPNIPSNAVTMLTIINWFPTVNFEPLKGSLHYYNQVKDEKINQPINVNMKKDGNGQSVDSDGNGTSQQNNQNTDKKKAKELKKEQEDGVSRFGSAGGGHKKMMESAKGKSDQTLNESAKKIVNNAKRKAESKGRGTVSGNISEQIEKLNKRAQIRWNQYLRKKAASIPNGFRETQNRLNRRLPYNLEKNGKITNYSSRIYFFVDISSSMSSKTLSVILNECYQISKIYKMELNLITFDAGITGNTVIKQPKDIKFEVSGRGGTSFQPNFDYLEEIGAKKDSLVVIATDGFGESSVDVKGYRNVLWLLEKDVKNLSVKNIGHGKVESFSVNVN